MDKFLTSIIFLGLLYIVKLLKDYYIFKNDPDCFNFHEKFQDSKATYILAVPISYVFCLVGAYEEWIAKLYCSELINSIIFIAGLLTVPFLISEQSKRKGGVANSISDMSGAIFFIATVTKPTIYLMLYILVFVVMLLLYIFKCEREDNCILHILVTIGIDAILILPSIISDDVVSWLFTLGFTDKMLYLAIVMLLSETIIPLISNQLVSLVYNRLKTTE